MDIIKEFGISKTVYSLCFPETNEILKSLWENSQNLGLTQMYENTWTKKQDLYHLSFAESFKSWSEPNLNIDWDKFKYFYPTNGASEAIREQIAFIKANSNKPIFVFEGEYEGYEAIANAMAIPVIKINRDQYKDYNNILKEGGHFFISQPSSIDGNIWNEYDNFMTFIDDFDIDVYIDTVYIGCIASDFKIDLNYENIKGVFFSLSKAFGVYYHRIGGVFLKESNPLLYGNMWFKNIFSMRFGEELMNNFKVDFFAKKYEKNKLEAINKIEKSIGCKVYNSDSLLIANINKSNEEYMNLLIRDNKADIVRICITPTLEKIIRN